MIASWNGTVLAESDDTVVVDGNHYFPEASLKKERFVDSQTHSNCPWKGVASYYSRFDRGRRVTSRLCPALRPGSTGAVPCAAWPSISVSVISSLPSQHGFGC